jgi:hypothetical protein
MCVQGPPYNVACMVCCLPSGCHPEVFVQKTTDSLPVIPNMIKILVPAMASHIIPKKAVIILEWL